MKISVILAHPSSQSFNHAIAQVAVAEGQVCGQSAGL